MNLNYLLLWMSAASCATTLARSAHSARGAGRGWFMVSLGILVATSLVAIVDADYAGYVGGLLWLVLIVAPSIGARLLTRAVVDHDFRRARAISEFVGTLHPFDGWRDQPELLEALERAYAAPIDEAVEILRPYLESYAPSSGIAAAFYFRVTGRWEEALGWLRAHPIAAISDPTLLLLYIRALGEIGDVEGMIQTLMNGRAQLRRSAIYGLHAKLIAFAFAGRKPMVERLLRDRRMALPANANSFWLATAEMACGETESGMKRLRAADVGGTPVWQAAVSQRLAQAPRLVAGSLSPATEARLSRLEGEYFEEETYAAVLRPDLRRAHATTVLIVLNLVAFAVEVAQGGSKDGMVLYRLGALDVQAVMNGEWTRVIASTFLHYGFLHLLLNMLGLLVLGPFVEITAGARRFLFLYFGSGIGAMALIVLFTFKLGADAPLVAGASGSIMGIVGATAAILWRGWKRHRSRLARQRLFVVFVIIAFQVVFDFSTPEVSFLGHSLGAILGFLMARGMKLEPSRGSRV